MPILFFYLGGVGWSFFCVFVGAGGPGLILHAAFVGIGGLRMGFECGLG